MVERIDIRITESRLEKIEASKDLLHRARKLERTERVPVEINTNQWTLLAARNRRPADYVRSPRDNLREQILNHKWRLENIPDDLPIPETRLAFSPDLGCLRGTEFDMEIAWPEDQPPKATHPLTEPEEIDRLGLPDPDNGLNAKRIEWMRAMEDHAADFDVRLNGERLAIDIGLGQAGGPIPSAFALCGENLFLWILTDPDRVHRLMDLVTTSHLQCIRFFDDLMGRDPAHAVSMGADTIEMMSTSHFCEFVAPYYRRIYEAYPGPRGFHNCGKNEHLLDAIRDKLTITSHNGFGFGVDPDVLGEKMGGRVVLEGGPSPVVLYSGREEEIRRETRRYIDALAHYGGFVLQLGGGSVPGTPAEHYHFLIDEARQHSSRMTASSPT